MCDKHGTKVEKYIDTHEKCKNASFYSYGALYDGTLKSKVRNAFSIIVIIFQSQYLIIEL